MRCDNNTVILLCDRGAVDCLAYLNEEEKIIFFKKNAQSHDMLLARYNAVFHMYSVASVLPDLYSSESNSVRFETTEEAILSDSTLEGLWNKHSYYKKIAATNTFEEKLSQLANEIDTFLYSLN